MEIKHETGTCNISKAAPFTTSIMGRTSIPFGESSFTLRAVPPRTYVGSVSHPKSILPIKKLKICTSPSPRINSTRSKINFATPES